MKSIIDEVITRYIEAFCAAEMPDAGDWKSGSYEISRDRPDELKQTEIRVNVDVPTSSQNSAWLSFVIDTDGPCPKVTDFDCIRSGLGDDAGTTYHWSSRMQKWELASSSNDC